MDAGTEAVVDWLLGKSREGPPSIAASPTTVGVGTAWIRVTTLTAAEDFFRDEGVVCIPRFARIGYPWKEIAAIQKMKESTVIKAATAVLEMADWPTKPTTEPRK